MTHVEILNALSAGESVYKQENMIFKYGKLVRGTRYSFRVGNKTISATQFTKLQDENLLSRIDYRLGETEYKLKKE